MKYIFKILLLITFIFLNTCSKDKEKLSVIKNENIQLLMIDAYKEGVRALEFGDVLLAAKKFNEAELLFPQSDWASRASLMAAYSYYTKDYLSDAIFELERFLKVYPKSQDISYAHFLLAMCYYESIIDEKKDLDPLLKSKKRFEYIIKKYPKSDFAMDAKFKLGLIQDILASKEIHIGKHYMKKEKWIAAINRFKTVINEYSTTVYVEEALHRLVEIHYKIGLKEESKKYANILGYNYLSSKWYKESYRVFNKKYTGVQKINPKKKKKK